MRTGFFPTETFTAKGATPAGAYSVAVVRCCLFPFAGDVQSRAESTPTSTAGAANADSTGCRWRWNDG